jgi:hypothetical protein
MTIAAWLAAVKARGATITVANGHPTTRPFLPTDRQPLERHAHALRTAAAGTHPAWWTHVARAGPLPTELDDIPTVAYADSGDGVAFACVQCGRLAETLDQQLLAWCNQHA